MKLSDKMTLPIDGPLIKPIMTISELTVRLWRAEARELEAKNRMLKLANRQLENIIQAKIIAMKLNAEASGETER